MAKRRGKSKLRHKGKVSSTPVISSPASSEPAEPDILNTAAILAAAFNAAIQPVLKVCRLCEAKDGPFLNIFSAEKLLAKKIEDLLPFVIREDDELPHKICFRCSAKVEELHEFVQKCIRSQENLEKTLGKSGFHVSKTTSRKTWEEKLNKSNISNADICDAVIKKAMEGVQRIQPLASEELDKEHNGLRKTINNVIPEMKDAETETDIKTEKTTEVVNLERTTDLDKENPNKQIPDKTVDKIYTTRSTSELPLDKVVIPPRKKLKHAHSKGKPNATNIEPENKTTEKTDEKTEGTELKVFSDKASIEESKPPFDIKDYVITVKINGVGNLFQCKLCNRNFMQEVTVLSHACAKTGVPKVDFTKSIVQAEPPKNPPTNVKYITQKNVSSGLDAAPSSNVKPKSRPCPASKKKSVNETVIDKNEQSSALAESKLKHISKSDFNVKETSTIPGLKSRYKLLPGPNNTFTLFEQKHKENGKNNEEANKNVEVINLDDDVSDDVPESILPNLNTNDQPYPVGLFQTMPHPTKTPPLAFTTPALKKQSYTVVQTGNPSKLLISAKTPLKETDAVEHVSENKKGKKRKADTNLNETQTEKLKQPFSVTLEDSTHPKESNEGFFTFINVDPLLQPSYVLPTPNAVHIQKASSKSAASGSNTTYNCHICQLSFNRDTKLQAHLQSHYKDIDKDEDIFTIPKKLRKRTRNS